MLSLNDLITSVHDENKQLTSDIFENDTLNEPIPSVLALLAAFCYFCTLTEDECQSTSRVMKGMPITRTVKKLRAYYFKMKSLAENSKKV